jgi:hypothetical protein
VAHAVAGRRARRPRGPALAALVGLTWAANVVEAGIVPAGRRCSPAACSCRAGAAARRPTGRLLVLAFGLALVLVAAWGAWWGGFPQPSELGWLSRPFSDADGGAGEHAVAVVQHRRLPGRRAGHRCGELDPPARRRPARRCTDAAAVGLQLHLARERVAQRRELAGRSARTSSRRAPPAGRP